MVDKMKRKSRTNRENDGFSGVDAVERALTLLDAFNGGDSALPLKELSQRSGLTKTTILRLAVSLERFGYLTGYGRPLPPRSDAVAAGFSLSAKPRS